MMIVLDRIWRAAKWGLSIFVLFAVAFFSLAFVSARFPTQGRMQAPDAQPSIYVCAGLVHTDFAIPRSLSQSDRFGVLARHIPANLPDDSYVLMGWGDYRFFTEVPTLSDLRPGIAFGALTGQHETAVRLQPVNYTYVAQHCRELPLDQDGRIAIVVHIRDTLVSPPSVLSKNAFGLTYIKANKRYGLFHTCNDWTSDAMRKAGLPTARWTAPFAFSVTWPLRSASEVERDINPPTPDFETEGS